MTRLKRGENLISFSGIFDPALISAGACKGELEGPDSTGGIGNAFAGDAESSAVVGAGAVAREPKGNIDRVVEIEKFEGDESLVVVRCQNSIELPQCRIPVHAVRHAGT